MPLKNISKFDCKKKTFNLFFLWLKKIKKMKWKIMNWKKTCNTYLNKAANFFYIKSPQKSV